jgi:hypothetical protein
MTFVILNKIENEETFFEDQIFDSEPFNYIFNKSTSFLDGEFVKNDHLKLEKILENFLEIDPDLLDQLQYFHVIDNQKNMNSVLHLAVQANNYQCIQVILLYMTSIKQNSCETFVNLFHELLCFKNFPLYLQELPFQTFQMKSKQVLRVS